jgi:hypothetical protein
MRPQWKPKVWQRILFVLACLATAAALFYKIEDYRGAAAWDRYWREAEQRGVKLDLRDFLPAPVPEEENFAAIPELKALSSHHGEEAWENLKTQMPPATPYVLQLPTRDQLNGQPLDFGPARDELFKAGFVAKRTDSAAADILDGLERSEPVLDPIRAALSRPYAQLIVEDQDMGIGSSLRQSASELSLGRVFKLEALVLLETGDHEKALTDVMVQERLSQMYEPEPAMLAAMLRIIILAQDLAVVREGINLDEWTEGDAAEIEKSLGDVNFPADCIEGFASERAQTNLILDQIKSGPRSEWARRLLNPNMSKWWLWGIELMPRGWIDQNKVVINQWYDRILADPTMRQTMIPLSRFPRPYTFIAAECARFVGANYEVAEGSQNEVNVCRLALALRRYCNRNGHYPDSLDDLAPDFIPQVPAPITRDGGPQPYRRTAEGAVLGQGWHLRNPAPISAPAATPPGAS